ncbi:hypothetical protein N665_0116s0016 [Sinapis alba]|nr:hypothetical protein N665_0116s0016 [Sinapis alba]
MSDREKRDEEAKETDTRTESTSMEDTEGQDTDLRMREADARTDQRHKRDPRFSGEKRMRHELGQSSEYPVRTGVEDCYFYQKNGRCFYGRRCRFNHPPRNRMRHDTVQPSPDPVRSQLPESSQMRHEPSPYPVARDCRQYLQSGKCSYGPKCRFNHPPAHPAPVLPERVNRQNCKEREAHDLEEQKQKKRKVGNLRIDPTVQSGEGGIQTEQRFEIPENRNVVAQENLQEQADDMERENREAQEKAQEERRQQIDNARRKARLRLERMKPRGLTNNVDQLREALPDIGIDRKEGDGF